MTDDEWQTCQEPYRLLRHACPVKRYVTLEDDDPLCRKKDLLAVACCRLLRPWLTGQCLALADRTELAADSPAAEPPPLTDIDDALFAARLQARDGVAQETVDLLHGIEFAGWDRTPGSRVPPTILAGVAALVRDVFGNPFRPIAFDLSWRTSTAVALASQMYESRDFGAMPILADALQDAGCDSADVLDHCRGPGPHVRGCWVVDLVLGKS